MKYLLIYIFLLSFAYSLFAENFCTTYKLIQLCGANVLEYKIDSARISPATNCEAVFIWYPPIKGVDNCFICGDKNTTIILDAIASKKKIDRKKCGKILKVNKTQV
jgi:hypothetical protein